MYIEEQWLRDGIRKAIEITNMSGREACIRAKCNVNQVQRILLKDHMISFNMAIRICQEGFGLPFETVLRMGQAQGLKNDPA